MLQSTMGLNLDESKRFRMLVDNLFSAPDHFCPPDSLLQLHQPLLVLVPLHKHPSHLHPGEPPPLSQRHVAVLRQGLGLARGRREKVRWVGGVVANPTLRRGGDTHLLASFILGVLGGGEKSFCPQPAAQHMEETIVWVLKPFFSVKG